MNNTTPIYTIIVDDHISCINQLSGDLKKYPEIVILEIHVNIIKAKTAILKHQPNLLFLDIEMPEQSGLQFLQDIAPYIHPGMCVVFYSAFDKYMIDALRADAFDFLLKPYQLNELDYIVNRVRNKIISGKINFDWSKYRMLNSDRKFALHTISGLVLLNKIEVLYFEYMTHARCWQLVLTNFSVHKLQTTTTSKDILEITSSFVQINRECIVNLDYLSSIESNTYKCSLYPPFQNIKIEASRRYYAQLKNKLEFL